MKLSSNKTYILPSRFGLGLIFITFLVFIIAITFGHPFSYFITFFLTSIIVVCAFSTNSTISKLKTFHFHDEFIECGNEELVSVNISNREYSSSMSLYTTSELSVNEKATIISNENNKLRFSLKSDHCGILKMSRIKIHTTFPLGIFRAWKYIDSNKQVIVYPKRVVAGDIYRESLYSKGSESENIYNIETKDEFLDHRKFRDTDSWKHIDWKAFARGRGLLTKNFSGQDSNAVVLSVNHKDNINYLGKVTDQLFKSYDSSIETILLVDGEVTSKGNNKVHLYECLRILARLGEKCE
ncbi:DUF58 domain-containing protein [Halobacteriovorax sp.]|uniref:DUF58 domain-containing protein n=1 Tax=Halobacteriovorax sp. TaxID=2020862 RepID=UPI0035660892